MTTTSDVKVTPGSGKNVATYSFSEDAETKEAQRVVLNSSAGAEIDLSLGQKATTSSTSVVPASDAPNFPVSGTVSIIDLSNAEYETVAASQTDQVLGATGGTGDYLAGLLIVPATAAAGAVSIKDGSGSSITVFAGGGATALPTLAPIPVPLGIKSTGGAWKVTTGTNVSAIGIGNFT